MPWLVLGVLLFAGLHLVPAAAVEPRRRLIERLGEPAYKGAFALGVISAVVLMVVGWRSASPAFVYAAPAWGRTVSIPLMLVALLLFAASGMPTNLKRLIRHPQLTAVATWAATHLLSNGDTRSLVLFGGLGAWAILEMTLLNRRDGAWQRPEALPLSAELKPAIGGLLAFALLYLVHPYIAGVPVLLQ